MFYTKIFSLNDESLSYETIIDTIDNKKFEESAIKNIYAPNNAVDFIIEKKLADASLQIRPDKCVIYTIYEYIFKDIVSSTEKSHQLIVFKDVDNKNVNFIVENPSTAKRFIRSILGYQSNDKQKVEDLNDNGLYTPVLKDNFLYWIISKIYRSDASIQDNLFLDSITKLKGRTQLLNMASTEGSGVTNMLTTLAFLLESKHLSNIIIKVNYQNDRHRDVVIAIRKSNASSMSIGTDVTDYVGEYSKDEYLTAKLLLLIYLDALPSIIFEYKDTESPDEKKIFIENIKTDLLERIESI